MLRKNGNVVMFTDVDKHYVSVRVSSIDSICQIDNGNILLELISGDYYELPVEEFITYGDVVCKLFY